MAVVHKGSYPDLTSLDQTELPRREGSATPNPSHTGTTTLNTMAIFVKHLWEKLMLRENFGTGLQQNQRTLQIFKIMQAFKQTLHFLFSYFSITICFKSPTIPTFLFGVPMFPSTGMC